MFPWKKRFDLALSTPAIICNFAGIKHLTQHATHKILCVRRLLFSHGNSLLSICHLCAIWQTKCGLIEFFRNKQVALYLIQVKIKCSSYCLSINWMYYQQSA